MVVTKKETSHAGAAQGRTFCGVSNEQTAENERGRRGAKTKKKLAHIDRYASTSHPAPWEQKQPQHKTKNMAKAAHKPERPPKHADPASSRAPKTLTRSM